MHTTDSMFALVADHQARLRRDAAQARRARRRLARPAWVFAPRKARAACTENA
jgi:hypothetical protein